MSDYGRRSIPSSVLLLLFCLYIVTSSCVSTKKIVYFKDLPDTISKPIFISQVTPFVEPRIESNDILSVTVQPLLQNNGSAASPISANINSSAGAANAPNTYLVDKNGNIEVSLIGMVKVAGLTTIEAKEHIKDQAKVYYKDPVVSVRITNFEYTVIGDVPKSGIFVSPTEKVSIIDAIANTGDLNLTAKRDNILLIRSIGDQKMCMRYDISSSKIFQNPYFYLKQRDMIYVEPNKYKVQSSDQTFIRNLGILSSLISLASVILVFRTVK